MKKSTVDDLDPFNYVVYAFSDLLSSYFFSKQSSNTL